MERKAVTRFGLSFSEFWNSTPRELDLLLEQVTYEREVGMDRVRHIMSAVTNTVVDRKKRKYGFTPQEILRLPLMDGKSTKTTEQLYDEKDAAQAALKRMKDQIKRKKENDG